jgi:hypothetical protein
MIVDTLHVMVRGEAVSGKNEAHDALLATMDAEPYAMQFSF